MESITTPNGEWVRVKDGVKPFAGRLARVLRRTGANGVEISFGLGARSGWLGFHQEDVRIYREHELEAPNAARLKAHLTRISK